MKVKRSIGLSVAGKPLESDNQSKIIKRYEADGWYVIKLIQTTKNGIPDLLLLKDGTAFFIEVKREGREPEPLQKLRIKELKKFGIKTIVLDTPL